MERGSLMGLTEHRYPSFEPLCQALQEAIERAVQRGIRDKGWASVMLSGGGTPAPLYRQLCEADLPWDKVCLCLSDERWVPSDHALSNQKMLQQTLLQGEAAQAQLLSFVDGYESPEQAVERLQQPVGEMMADGWDFALLGMGLDGHTASLFPDAPELAQGLAPSDGAHVCVTTPAVSEVARLSLTLPCLLRCREIALLLRGDDKWAVYQQALEAKDPVRYPVSAVLGQGEKVDVYWSA